MVVLLVAIAVLAIIFVRFYVTPIPKKETADLQPYTREGEVPTTRLDQYQADIDAARAVQDTISASEVLPEEMLP